MKITNKRLKQIIKEELQKTLNEADNFSSLQVPSTRENKIADMITSNNPNTIETALGLLEGLGFTEYLGRDRPFASGENESTLYTFMVKKTLYDAIINALNRKRIYSFDNLRNSSATWSNGLAKISEPYVKYYNIQLHDPYHAILTLYVAHETKSF